MALISTTCNYPNSTTSDSTTYAYPNYPNLTNSSSTTTTTSTAFWPAIETTNYDKWSSAYDKYCRDSYYREWTNSGTSPYNWPVPSQTNITFPQSRPYFHGHTSKIFKCYKPVQLCCPHCKAMKTVDKVKAASVFKDFMTPVPQTCLACFLSFQPAGTFHYKLVMTRI